MPVLIGPDNSIYAGIGNPYLSLQEAQTTPSRELYTDSIVKLSQATGKLEWYYQAFPDDFHDWDLQISPIYTTTAGGRPVVLAAGKGGFVFAFDAASGQLLWKTAVGIHNGHDDDDQQALEGTLQLTGAVHTVSRRSWRGGDQHGSCGRRGLRAGRQRADHVHVCDVSYRHAGLHEGQR